MSQSKFTTPVDTLKTAFKRLGVAVLGKPTLPVLENMLVSLEKDRVTLTTTDLHITVSYDIACQTEGPDAVFLVPFNIVKKILPLEVGDISIRIEDDGNVWLNSATDEFCLGNPGEPSDFPKLPSVAEKNKFDINGTFIPSMCMAALGVSGDDLRPALTNVLVELRAGKVTVVSTDAHSLYSRSINVETAFKEDADLLVPAKVADILDGYGAVKIGYNKNFMSFESGHVTVCAKRGDGQYPQWRAIVPMHDPNITLNLEELKGALTKALIVTSDVHDNGVDLFISIDRIQLRTETEDTGRMSTCLINADAATCTTERIRLNGRLFKRMLEQVSGHASETGSIELMVQAATKAVTISIAGQPELTCIVMPIMING